MTIQTPSPSLKQAREYLFAMDLTPVTNSLVHRYHWVESHALATCQYYRNFLFLIKKYHKEFPSLPPSPDIDEFWHLHILQTQQYHKDCLNIFGKYLHHQPENHLQSKEKKLGHSLEDLQKLHFEEFGEYIYMTKSRYPKIIYSVIKKFNLIK